MRRNTEQLNQIPPELPDDRAKEITPPPDEFNRDMPTGEPPGRTPSGRSRIMLLLATAGVATLGVIMPIIQLNPEKETIASVEETATQEAITEATAVPQDTPSSTVAPTPESTAAPTPESTVTPTVTPTPQSTISPTPEITPVPTSAPKPEPEPTEQIHITVYSDLYDETADNPYHSGILAEETLDAESFAGYSLPQLPEQAGGTCIGYVLVTGSSTDYMEEQNTPGSAPHPIGTVSLGNTLLPEDIRGLVAADGVYEAEIHAAWIAERSRFLIRFCDGEDPMYSYYVLFPLEKQGLLYLDAFPKPEKRYVTFVGWCDADGHMVDVVTYAEFFTKLSDRQPPDDRDWSRPRTYRVYACWSDGSGGVPEVTKYSVRCSNCSFTGGGYTGAAKGSVPSGKAITVTGLTDSNETYFRITYADGSSERRTGVYRGRENGKYRFTCTITVTKDITDIYVYGIVN